METAKVAVEGTDVVAPDAVVVDSETEPTAAEVTSHPLPDLFGAQVRTPCRTPRSCQPALLSCWIGMFASQTSNCSMHMQPCSGLSKVQPPLFHGLQELISELQDQEQFGKRGEAWTFAQLAAVVLVVLPPFQLTVCTLTMQLA